MAFKGSLREAGLADVVQLLALGFKTGCLSVTDRSRFGQIYFEKGRISYAQIINRRDRLGDMLQRDGKLTEDRLRDALDAQEKEPHRRLGELLLERGWIAEQDVEGYVRRQVESAVYHLFTWSRGSFFFEPGQRPDSAEMLFAINAESLLLEAARRVDEWTLIEKKIPSFDVVFAADQERAQTSGAPLTAEQLQVLPLLDGTRSLRALIDATGLLEFDVGHATFGLLQAGFAREVGHSAHESRGGEPEPFEVRSLANAFYRAGMFEDAEREYRRLLERRPGDEPAHLRLAAIALRDGRPDDALAELESLLQVHGPRYVALLNLATVLRLQNRDEDALIALNQAEALRPESAAVALERGILALRARRVVDARRELDESRRRLGPDAVPTARWYYHAALAAALGGQSEAAGTLVREGLGAHPESPPLLLMAGLLAERDGDLDAAERSYAQVVELDPGIVQVHKNLGDIAFRRGTHEHALALYQRTIEMAPDLGDDVYAKLGTLYYQGRNRDGAIRCWRRSLELNPDNELVRNNLDIVARVGA